MTKAEFATHRGVGRSAVSNWAKAGLLVEAEAEGGRLKVDVRRTEARLASKLDPARGRPAKGRPEVQETLELQPHGRALVRHVADGELGEVRVDLLREQRIGQRLKNARTAGELVPLAEYERRSSELGRLARERMYSVVRTMAERLAAEAEPRQIVALLTAEIDRAFTELADQVQAGALAQADMDDEAALEDAEAAAEAAEIEAG